MRKRRTSGDRALRGATVAFVLGSGLGGLVARFSPVAERGFEEVPGVGASTVEGHRGTLALCRVGRRSCLFVSGRHHHYEGRPSETPALMAYVRELGISSLVLTCAAGSAAGALPPGRLVLVDDLVDFQFRRPVPPAAGAGAAAVPPRTQRAGSGAAGTRGLRLDPRLSGALMQAAIGGNVRLGRGVMACVAGPVYETAAEVAGLRDGGPEIFSMSVAPEVASANALGMKVATIAVITNWATGLSRETLHHGDVLRRGVGVEGDLGRLLAAFLGTAADPAGHRGGAARG